MQGSQEEPWAVPPAAPDLSGPLLAPLVEGGALGEEGVSIFGDQSSWDPVSLLVPQDTAVLFGCQTRKVPGIIGVSFLEGALTPGHARWPLAATPKIGWA